MKINVSAANQYEIDQLNDQIEHRSIPPKPNLDKNSQGLNHFFAPLNLPQHSYTCEPNLLK